MKSLYNVFVFVFLATLTSLALASDEVAQQAPTLLDRIEHFFEAFPAWLIAITTVVTSASAIVKLTPTKKDDKVLESILRVLNFLAINPSEKDKKGK